MIFEQAMQLLTVLAQSPYADVDFGLRQALSAYIEIHIRVATKLLQAQLIAEGFTEDDLAGYSPESV